MEERPDLTLAPDWAVAPEGFVVTVHGADRIHFLDWSGVAGGGTVGSPAKAAPGTLLVHGLSQTAWIWTPIARRLHTRMRVIAMDLRGHGLSDAPTDDGAYTLDLLVDDVEAVAEGSRLLDDPADRMVLVGHGFGASIAAAAAARLGARCAGLVLVDGGWESAEASTGLEVDEFLRGLDEPPGVMASMAAYLADRAGFDPSSWDADQDRAARATVVETHAGRVVPATRPHALAAAVRTMFAYDPRSTLAGVVAPVVALLSGDDEEGRRSAALADVQRIRAAAGLPAIREERFPHAGHNLMRYRPDDVAAAIMASSEAPPPARSAAPAGVQPA